MERVEICSLLEIFKWLFCYSSKIEKSKVITLKFSVDKNSLLSLNVSTFTKIKCTKFNLNKYIFLLFRRK